MSWITADMPWKENRKQLLIFHVTLEHSYCLWCIHRGASEWWVIFLISFEEKMVSTFTVYLCFGSYYKWMLMHFDITFLSGRYFLVYSLLHFFFFNSPLVSFKAHLAICLQYTFMYILYSSLSLLTNKFFAFWKYNGA